MPREPGTASQETEPRASTTTTANAPAFTQRVHAVTGRTVVSAVTTK
jgi:hypothetical protein